MTTPTTAAGRALLRDVSARYAGNMPDDPVSDELTTQQVLAIEAEARAAALDEARAADWEDEMLDALRASDGGNNPFYSDDPDTVQLARELADAVLAAIDALREGSGAPDGTSARPASETVEALRRAEAGTLDVERLREAAANVHVTGWVQQALTEYARLAEDAE